MKILVVTRLRVPLPFRILANTHRLEFTHDVKSIHENTLVRVIKLSCTCLFAEFSSFSPVVLKAFKALAFKILLPSLKMHYIAFNFLTCFKDFLMHFELLLGAILQMKQLRG